MANNTVQLTILFKSSPNFSKWKSQFLGKLRIFPAFFHRNPQHFQPPKDLSKPNSASRNVMVTSVCRSTPARRKAACFASTSFKMTSPGTGKIKRFFFSHHTWNIFGTFMEHWFLRTFMEHWFFRTFMGHEVIYINHLFSSRPKAMDFTRNWQYKPSPVADLWHCVSTWSSIWP